MSWILTINRNYKNSTVERDKCMANVNNKMNSSDSVNSDNSYSNRYLTKEYNRRVVKCSQTLLYVKSNNREY